MVLRADFLELEMPELVAYLLRETEQTGESPTNPQTLLDYLNLRFVRVDLEALFPGQKKQPRGVLSYADRIVGVDQSLDYPPRARFTIMHEMGHYVLPRHQDDLYLCNKGDLSPEAKITAESEANAFAAELLFKGDQFTRQANDYTITPESIKVLKQQYDASFEATARRFVERNARACGLLVFNRVSGGEMIDPSRPTRWATRYFITSVEFCTRYFCQFTGEAPADVIEELTVPGRDFADDVVRELAVTTLANKTHHLRISFSFNQHNVFGLVQPLPERNK